MKSNIKTLCTVIFISILHITTVDAHSSDYRISVTPTDYKLDVTVDYETGILSGICRLTVRNITADETNYIPLLLYRLMHVISVKDAAGSNMRFDQNIVPFTDLRKMQVNAIIVHLDHPLAPGEEKNITIDYAGYLLGYTETGMQYVKDSVHEDFTIIRNDAFAFPSVGIPEWKTIMAAGLPAYNYEIAVTVPSRFTVANGGELISKITQNGETTYVYRNIKQSWRIDIAIADYKILEKDKLRIFYFNEDEEGARKVLTEMEYTIDLFTRWFGPVYDYGGFTVIQVPETYGSQADVTSIIQTSDAFRDENNIVELYHELSHIWNVRDNDESPPRWNEGLAMFLQYLVYEKRHRKEGVVTGAAEGLRESFRRQYGRSARANITPMIDYGKENLTGLSYNKGMLFFYVYYHLVGEKEFLNTIGNQYQKYIQTGITTPEFLDFIVESSSNDIAKFVQDWFYTVDIDKEILAGTPLQSLIEMYR